jgi:hypothetical protein
MRIRIEGVDLPGAGPGPDLAGGLRNVHVAVQRRGKRDELLGLVRGNAPSVTWTMDCVVTPAPDGRADVKGPYIQGPSGGRFIYLNWGDVSGQGEFLLLRRAKLCLDAVPADVLADAMQAGVLVGRLGLTDSKGGPLCASVRPPLIQWSAAAG